MSERFQYSVFTKPWKMGASELGEHVRELGFDGIELPVRPGYQVEPENVTDRLPVVAKQLADEGVKIFSVAGPIDEPTIAACGEVGIPFIRVMINIGDAGYLRTVAETQRRYDEVIPLLEKHGVTIGVQNHCGRFVGSAIGIKHAIGRYDPKHVAAVWDVAHCALEGEPPELAFDILRSHLCMINLKNGMRIRTNGPEAEFAEWRTYWTSGRHGFASWRKVADVVKENGWKGILCLTAEYSDHSSVNRLIAEDIALAKSLFD